MYLLLDAICLLKFVKKKCTAITTSINTFSRAQHGIQSCQPTASVRSIWQLTEAKCPPASYGVTCDQYNESHNCFWLSCSESPLQISSSQTPYDAGIAPILQTG